jgi:hypothetical protein
VARGASDFGGPVRPHLRHPHRNGPGCCSFVGSTVVDLGHRRRDFVFGVTDKCRRRLKWLCYAAEGCFDVIILLKDNDAVVVMDTQQCRITCGSMNVL